MEISTLEPVSEDVGAVVKLRNREKQFEFDGDGDDKTHVTVTVAGRYSNRYKKAVRAQKERNLRNRNLTVDADFLDASTLTLQTACIIAWDFTANGQPLPITETNWSAVLSKKPEYEEQVQFGIEEYASFFPKPSAI